jgi:enoyl-CoA hydratase/carnithine racemase
VSAVSQPADLHTLILEIEKGVASVTLNRPEVLNAFDERMQNELSSVWQFLRREDAVRAVVLTGKGDKAFTTGIDRSGIPLDQEFDPFTYDDPGQKIGPKSQGLWKPVIAAVNGMACGGAFYLLGESDIIIASDTATFFDPHVTYGMTASFEPMLLSGRMAFGDLVRMTLVGAHERISARTAREAGLVTEVVKQPDLLEEAQKLASVIASQPPASVQASLRTLWAARGLSPEQAGSLGNVFLQLGTSAQALRDGQETFSRSRVEWRLR